MEYNLVEMWLRKDPIRWVSGALAGLLAGFVALVVAAVIASALHYEALFPIKLIGSIILGPSATAVDNNSGVLPGVVLFEGVALFLGFVYGHFTSVNQMTALLPMGLVWGIFSWIFIWNLFMQSFLTVFAARIPSGAILLVCIAFGIALSSVSVFDRMLRKS